MEAEKELLRKLREMYLYDTDENGLPNASMNEIIKVWDKVNHVLDS